MDRSAEYRKLRKIEQQHQQFKKSWEESCKSVYCFSVCCLGLLCWRSQLKELRWLRELENQGRISDKDRVQIPCLCQSVGAQSFYSGAPRDFFHERDVFYGDGCCLCYKGCCIGDASAEVEKFMGLCRGKKEEVSDSD